MLTENKFRKYLLYAIGEIILVVIGILVALNVNNQNELRKEKNKEEKILIGIKNDFIETRKGLIKIMYSQENVCNNSLRLIDLIESRESVFNSDSISLYLTYGATSFYREEPLIGTYDALIGSGNTSIIQSQELLTALIKFSAISKLPFEEEANSMDLQSLITQSISDYEYVLTNDRNYIGVNYIYSEQEKQAAIKKLMNNKPFLSYLINRTNLEKMRLIRQKDLLGLTQDILSIFGEKDILLNNEELQKYLGKYEQIEGDKLKVEFIAKENRLYGILQGRSFIMLPDDQDSYYMILFGGVVKFEMENNVAIGYTYSSADETVVRKYKKVQ